MSPEFWTFLGVMNAAVSVFAFVGAMATDKPHLTLFGLCVCAFLALNAWGLLS